MTEAQLITKQQLEIETLKIKLREHLEAFEDINMLLCGIGGPLNDNVLNYTKEQRQILFSINQFCEDFISEERNENG